MKKLRISQIFSKLEVSKPIIDYIAHMHNFIVKFGKILDIFKEFAGAESKGKCNISEKI